MYRELKHNPKIIHLIVNDYCNGYSASQTVKQLSNKHNINISKDTILGWIQKYKKYIDLDLIRNKEKISFKECINLCDKLRNDPKDFKGCAKMRQRIINLASSNLMTW